MHKHTHMHTKNTVRYTLYSKKPQLLLLCVSFLIQCTCSCNVYTNNNNNNNNNNYSDYSQLIDGYVQIIKKISGSLMQNEMKLSWTKPLQGLTCITFSKTRIHVLPGRKISPNFYYMHMLVGCICSHCIYADGNAVLVHDSSIHAKPCSRFSLSHLQINLEIQFHVIN